MNDILIVEDETVLARSMASFLERRGFSSSYAADAGAARAMFDREAPRLVILDYRLNEDDGMELLEWMRRSDPRAHVVMMTGHGDVDVAVRAMKAGARDFLVKPAPLASIAAIARDLMLDDFSLAPDRTGTDRIVGRSAVANALRTAIRKLAVPAAPRPGVLIMGPRGSGKMLAARALHEASGGTEEGFVVFDCALPRADAEARLSDAVDRARGGSLVLRHVSALGTGAQAHLLAALDAASDAPSLIATTSDHLSALPDRQEFLPALLYRIQVGWIDVAPLCDRNSDILPIAEAHARDVARRSGLPRPRFTAEARARLLEHGWPGNVAELLNCIDRAMLLQSDGQIEADHIRLIGDGGKADEIVPLRDLELAAIRRALETTGGNVSRSADLLGISRDTLRYRMEKFGLSRH